MPPNIMCPATSCTSCPVLQRVITLYLFNMIPNSQYHVEVLFGFVHAVELSPPLVFPSGISFGAAKCPTRRHTVFPRVGTTVSWISWRVSSSAYQLSRRRRRQPQLGLCTWAPPSRTQRTRAFQGRDLVRGRALLDTIILNMATRTPTFMSATSTPWRERSWQG
jgi:hypothetical protein